MGGRRHAPAALYPGKAPVPTVQEAGRAPGPVWRGAENLAATGIRSRTVEPVASHYTDYATRPTGLLVTVSISKVRHSKIVVDCQTLKLEKLPSSETSVNVNQSTRRNTTEDLNLICFVVNSSANDRYYCRMSWCGYKYLERSEVTAAVLMIHTFWDVTLCRRVFPDVSSRPE